MGIKYFCDENSKKGIVGLSANLRSFGLAIFKSAKLIARKLKNSTSCRQCGSRDSNSFNFYASFR